MRSLTTTICAALLFALCSCASPARAAPCGDGAAGFSAWLADFRNEAAAQGLSARTLDATLSGVAYDTRIIARDRHQGVFHLSFEKFAARLITPTRLAQGKALLARHGALLRRIERHYGVPGPVLVSIWGMETGFGADNGKFDIMQSLATLAYDCRRSAEFTDQLKDALQIVERRDMAPAQMRGDWAGEIGQTQFMPSSYVRYAVDFDGDGRRDLLRSVPDALASTANYLKAKGWQAGTGWEQGEPNFPVFLEWNKAQVYAQTLAAFATRLGER